VTGWLGKVEQARKHKKPFDDIAEQCTAFFSAATGFMWEPKYRQKFLNTNTSPRFRMTMAKAFELVALFGPILYWRNPKRTVKSRKQIPINPDIFGPDNMREIQQLHQQLSQQRQQAQQGLQQSQQQMQQMQQQMQQLQQAAQQGDQQAQQQAQQIQQQVGQMQQQMQQSQQQLQSVSQQLQTIEPQVKDVQEAHKIFEESRIELRARKFQDEARASLMENWLNYTPDEQPGGGLAQHAEMAITEALVKGRGCLWVEPYTQPGSKMTLTGCFWDSVDNLLLDPDSESIDDAKYIIKREAKPVWQVERDFGLKEGALGGKGSLESAESQGEKMGDEMGDLHRKQGKSFDTIVYYRIWSKGGVGARLTGVNTPLKERFDKVVGDFAYIVVAADVPYPLNAPPKKFLKAKDDEVQEMFSWPVPYWKDDRWPVVLLDFYPKPRSAWPIAPLAPGLGELAFMNVVISHLANRIWSSSRDFIAVLKSAEEEVTKAIKKGDDLAIIPLNEVHQDINRVVSFLQQPQTNFDIWKILDEVMRLFERRTGLTELMSGMTATQSRSAEDVATKREQMSIRPDHMSGKVENWMAEAAKLEKFCARWFVKPKDVQHLFGKAGSRLWEKLVSTVPVESVVRELYCTVEAGSARKPNKMRETQNIQQAMQVLFPVLDKHADVTTDTAPLNKLLSLWAESVEFDIEGMELQQRLPMQFQPWFQQQQAQQMQQQQQQQQQQAQQQQQVEQQKMAMAQQQSQVKMQTEQLKQQGMSQKAQMDAQQGQQKMQADMAKAQMAAQQAQQKAQADQMKAQADMSNNQMKAQADMSNAQMDLKLAQLKAQLQGRQGQMDAMKSTLELEKSENEGDRSQQENLIAQAAKAQDIEHDERRHEQELRQDGETHAQEMRQSREEFQQSLLLQRATAREKNRSNGNGERDEDPSGQ